MNLQTYNRIYNGTYAQFTQQKTPIKEHKVDEKLQDDINQVKSVANKARFALFAVPTIRKLIGVIVGWHSGVKDYLHLVNTINKLPEDTHDIVKAFSLKNNPFTEYQKPFSFINETVLAKSNVSRHVEKFDTTLFETNLVQNNLHRIGITDFEDTKHGYKFEGKYFGKIIARSTLRVNKLTGLFLIGAEIPDIIKSEKKGKQALHSSVNVIAGLTLSAFFGAWFAYLGGGFGSLAGLGLGYLVGSAAANLIVPISQSS